MDKRKLLYFVYIDDVDENYFKEISKLVGLDEFKVSFKQVSSYQDSIEVLEDAKEDCLLYIISYDGLELGHIKFETLKSSELCRVETYCEPTGKLRGYYKINKNSVIEDLAGKLYESLLKSEATRRYLDKGSIDVANRVWKYLENTDKYIGLRNFLSKGENIKIKESLIKAIVDRLDSSPAQKSVDINKFLIDVTHNQELYDDDYLCLSNEFLLIDTIVSDVINEDMSDIFYCDENLNYYIVKK